MSREYRKGVFILLLSPTTRHASASHSGQHDLLGCSILRSLIIKPSVLHNKSGACVPALVVLGPLSSISSRDLISILLILLLITRRFALRTCPSHGRTDTSARLTCLHLLGLHAYHYCALISMSWPLCWTSRVFDVAHQGPSCAGTSRREGKISGTSIKKKDIL